MTDFFNKIIQGVDTPPPVIKGGYGTAPSTPVQQTQTSGVWGTASPSQESQTQTSTENTPTPAAKNNK